LRGAGDGHPEPEARRDPLYLDKAGSGDNMVNRLLWNLLLGAPLIAMLAAAVGYLATAQALLARLETSVAIWFLLLVVYHIIRRWMLIQRRRLAFDRAKHRRAEILAQRARGEDESPIPAARKVRWRRSERTRSRCHQYPVPAPGAFHPDADRAALGHRPVVRNSLRVWLPGEHLAVGRHLDGAGR
jgi:potassium efflux system protein